MPYKDKEKHRQAQREWAKRNRAKVAESCRKRRKEMRAWVDTLKAQSCGDCGGTFPPVCMDFHHCRGDKTAEIHRMANQLKTRTAILSEIAKCDLICANCHRLRHDIRN